MPFNPSLNIAVLQGVRRACQAPAVWKELGQEVSVSEEVRTWVSCPGFEGFSHLSSPRSQGFISQGCW